MTRLTVPVLAIGVASMLAQSPLPPPFPRTNATKLLENEKIAVWDIVWPKGQPTAMHRHPHDQVGTYYIRGGRFITQPDGTKREGMTEVGNLSTTRKGTTHIEEGATDPPLRAVFIELLQDTGPVSPVPDRSTLPRSGLKQLLDDERQWKQIKIAIYEPAFSIIGDPAKRDPRTRQSADHSMVYIIATLLRKAFDDTMRDPDSHV